MTQYAPKTKAYPFHAINPGGDKLFSVQQGIGIEDTLEAAGDFLAASIDILYKSSPESSDVYGAIYLAEMAKAAIEACIVDMAKGGKP